MQHKAQEGWAAAEESVEHVTAFCAQLSQECPSSNLVGSNTSDRSCDILVPPNRTQPASVPHFDNFISTNSFLIYLHWGARWLSG